MAVNGNSATKSGYNIKTAFSDIRSVCNILILQAAAVVTIYILYNGVQFNFSDTLMYHIIFSTVGYAFCMTSAIILFAGENIFGRTLTRYHKSWIHGTLIGIGSIFAITGISIEIDAKGDHPHFKSTHAITGLISMILMIIACVIGALVIKVRIIANIIPFIKPVWWKILHNLIGLLAYVIGMVSLCYGYETWWFQLIASEEVRLAILIVSSIITTYCSLTPLYVIYDYLKTALE